MERRELTRRTVEVLARAGFYVSDPDLFSTVNFDIIARRDALLLIVKVLTNVDAMKREVSDQMKVISKHLGAFPLMVGERNNMGILDEGVVYLRYGIPVMTLETVTDYFIEGVPPFAFSAPGGPYVNIDGEELKRVRMAKGISLGELAKAAGVSRKSIQLYESGSKAMFNVVIKMEEFLGKPVAAPVDAFTEVEGVDETPYMKRAGHGEFASHVFKRLKGLGFVVINTVKCPFDALSENKRILILTGLGKQSRDTLDKARTLTAISSIAEKDSVLVMDRETSRQNIEGTPVIAKRELDRIKDPDDIVTLVKERKKE